MDLAAVVIEPLRVVRDWLIVFLPRILGAFLICLVGWGLAALLRTAVVKLLYLLRIDRLSEKTELSSALQHGFVRLTLVELLGELTYWLIMIAAGIMGLQFMGVAVAGQWLEGFGYFIPRVAISIVVLLCGTWLASFLASAVRASSLNAGFIHGRLIAQAVHAAVVLVTLLMALQQLQIVTRPIEVALYILLAAGAFSVALAVGLGSQDLVRQALTDAVERWKAAARS